MYSDPNMSDTTLLVSVEDLINRAMGPPDVNIVNFKLIQMVLQILARQQRMLNQRVEIKVTELAAAAAATPPHKGLEESTESSSSKSPRHPERGRMAEIKEEREKDEMAASLKQKALEEQKEKERAERIKLKAEKQAQREQEKAGKVAQREQEKAGRAVQREQEKAERAVQREQEKAGRAEQREQEKAGKTALKEQEKAEKTAQKEQEKAEKLAQKEQEKAEKLEQKEQERAGKKAEKEQGKAERAAMKEQERAEKSAMKEQEKAAKSAMKEQEKAEKSAMKEQEKAEKSAMKEQEKAERSAMKEQEKAEKSAMREQEKAEKSAMREQEKAGKSAMREQEKAEKSAMKEKEKAEKSAMKEQEKAEKSALKEQEKEQKGQEKAERREQLEKEKGEKQALKEKERLLKEAEKIQKEALKVEKETEKEKKRSAKEQEKAEREKARAEKEEERARSRSKSPAGSKKEKKDMESLSITETMRGQESVIVVEKGPTTRSDSRSRTNIDVVTQSQFALLDAAVRQLKEVAVPQPLAMPDNEKLRSDLAKGTASLPDTMQAMQVGARVKAAETAIERMTGLLTQLAAAGALPDHVAEQVESAAAEAAAQDREPFLAKSHASVAPKKSVLIDPKLSQTTHLAVRPSAHSSEAVTPRHSILSRQSTVSMGPGVTHEEMNTALKDLREDLSKNLQGVVGRAAVAADSALHTAMNVANKLDVALKLDVRISSLFTLVSDYAEQLSGFDAGLTTQMQSFKDQIGQMRTDLKSGLAQLENVNNNAETAAVMELTERYTELVGELDTTLSAHNSLQRLQGQLGDEMHSLVECVEMLREQKCDRDEVLDGLRDKADISRLSGLLSESQFAAARSDFERRLDLCHDKFRRQDGTWTTAVKDLSRLTDQKAELIELLSLRDHTERQLQELHDRLRVLAVALGEPKAALLTRMMSRGASCGACGTAALMEPQDAQAGAPPRLPPLRPQPEPEPCTRWVTAEPPLDRHTCHRWVGGSHTLLPVGGSAGRETAATAPSAHDQHRTHKYTGYGDDGRLYMMEEDLKPCIECNMLSTSELPQPGAVAESGAGDVQNCTPMDS